MKRAIGGVLLLIGGMVSAAAGFTLLQLIAISLIAAGWVTWGTWQENS